MSTTTQWLSRELLEQIKTFFQYQVSVVKRERPPNPFFFAFLAPRTALGSSSTRCNAEHTSSRQHYLLTAATQSRFWKLCGLCVSCVYECFVVALLDLCGCCPDLYGARMNAACCLQKRQQNHFKTMRLRSALAAAVGTAAETVSSLTPMMM